MIKKGGAILKIISILIVVMILLKFCLVFLWPFVGAILFVIFIEPLVIFIKGFGFNRKTSVIITFVTVILILFSTFFYLSTYAYTNFSSLINNLPEVIGTFVDKIKFLKQKDIDYSRIVNTLEQLILTYRVGIFNTVVSTLGGTVYTIIILINTFFISLDLEKIYIKLRKFLPTETYSIGSRVMNKMSSIMKIELKLVFFSTLQAVLGLYILGEREALTVGLICGILDLLPVVGPGMIFIPWAIYKILVNEYFIAIGLILLYILLEISREILQIKLMGRNLRIHPVITIFSFYIGLLIYGMWGVILGPLLFILFQELINFYYEGRSFQSYEEY